MINMNARDLNATYHGTYVGYREADGSVTPLLVRECERTNELRTEKDGDWFRVDINDPRLVLEFPDSGVYAVDDFRAAYVSRRAERQWHRGIRERAVRIHGDLSFSARLVRAMYNPRYFSLESILSSFSSGNFRSGALNRNWWIRKQDGAQHPLIMFRERVVGEIIDDEPTFSNPVMKAMFEEVTRDNNR